MGHPGPFFSFQSQLKFQFQQYKLKKAQMDSNPGPQDGRRIFAMAAEKYSYFYIIVKKLEFQVHQCSKTDIIDYCAKAYSTYTKSSIPRQNEWARVFLLACTVWLAQSCQSCLMMQLDEKSSQPCMMSLDECMQVRKMHAHSFYLGIDDFGTYTLMFQS